MKHMKATKEVQKTFPRKAECDEPVDTFPGRGLFKMFIFMIFMPFMVNLGI